LSESKKVIIYTDGACLGNPGPGGYGVVLLYGDNRKEISGGFRLTTNNRMEIMAAIVGLEALKSPCSVTLYSDSQYLVDAMMKGWAARWRESGWRRNKRERAVNPDLWERLLDLSSRHRVEFVWVRGHSGNRENERCDRLSREAASLPGLPEDTGYLQSRSETPRAAPLIFTAEDAEDRRG
jgi:ribonuclease HI